MINLDEKDKKLLYELDSDASLTINLLSKKIGLSQEATRYRIGRLIGRKIIRGFVTYLNFVKLGYFGYSVYCRYSNITEKKKQEIKNYLKKHENIYWIAEYGGKFDMSFSVFAKTPFEFDKILSGILNKYSNFLTDITLITKLEPHKYNRKYLIEKKKTYEQKRLDDEYYKLSATEKQVLKQISPNARISFADIARKIKKPISTVIYTIKKLEKNKVILGYTSLIDPSLFGHQAFQLNIITQNVCDEKIKKLFEYCNNNKNIVLAIKVLGDWNVELIYEVENAKKMQEEIIELRNVFGEIIKGVELINFFEDYIKLDHYPFSV